MGDAGGGVMGRSVGSYQGALSARAAALEVFSSFDSNGDGVLSFAEHAAAERELLRRRGVTAENAELRAAFNRFDIDHSGTVDFDEFYKGLWATPEASDAPKASGGVSGRERCGVAQVDVILSRLDPAVGSALSHDDVHRTACAFRIHDGDGDGLISPRSFERVVARLGAQVRPVATVVAAATLLAALAKMRWDLVKSYPVALIAHIGRHSIHGS